MNGSEEKCYTEKYRGKMFEKLFGTNSKNNNVNVNINIKSKLFMPEIKLHSIIML